MTDREALLRAIRANPDDDTPRLVYADWLQENDRAEEAEFIRAQCRLAALPPDHPEYTDLLDREEESRLWLTAHAPCRNPTFPAGLVVDAGPRRWSWCRRGFPRFLEFTGTEYPGLKAMRALAAAVEKAFARLPTRWLVVRFVTVEQLAELLKQPVVAGLDRVTVQLRGDVDAAAAAGVIADSPNLRNLRGAALAFPIDAAAAAALARSPHLGRMEWLSADADALDPAAVRSLCSAAWFRGLRELSLDDGLGAAAFEELCRSEPFPELHGLDLSNGTFPREAWEAFARSGAFPRVARLDLHNSNLTGGRAAALASARLRFAAIDLTGCSIGKDGAEALAAAPWFESLRRLALGHNRLGPGGTAAVAGSPRLAGLRHLDLSGNQVGAGGLQAVARNPALRGLTSLDLGCDVGDSSLTPDRFHDFLAQLDVPGLRHLDLSNRPVGPKAARLLAGEKFGSLTRLNLSGCGLTDAAAAALISAPALQGLTRLNLEGNRLKSAVKLLTDRSLLPRLSDCPLFTQRLTPEVARKLAHRPGVQVREIPGDVEDV